MLAFALAQIVSWQVKAVHMFYHTIFNHLYPQLTVTNLYSSLDQNNQMNMLVLEARGLSPSSCCGGVEYWMLLLIACS